MHQDVSFTVQRNLLIAIGLLTYIFYVCGKEIDFHSTKHNLNLTKILRDFGQPYKVLVEEESIWDGPNSKSDARERRLPGALIAGVKKGGTRALLEFLRQHPDVRAAGPETHFFDRHYQRGVEWYRRQMPVSLISQLTVEKTPSYFVSPEVPGRLWNTSRDVLLVVVVRNPIERALSDFAQTAAKTGTSVQEFSNKAFNQDGSVRSRWSALRLGLYAQYLTLWLHHFPREQILFVSGERLAKSPASEMKRVQKFLKLPILVTEENFYFNSTKGFPCLRHRGHRQTAHCLGGTKGRPHPKLSKKEREKLGAYFQPYNLEFYRMVGENFGWI